MQTRRSFFKTLGTIVGGTALAFNILPSATTYQRKFKVDKKSGLVVPNPDYFTAPYEVAFLASGGFFLSSVGSAFDDNTGIMPYTFNPPTEVAEKLPKNINRLPYPIRFRSISDYEQGINVAPFKQV